MRPLNRKINKALVLLVVAAVCQFLADRFHDMRFMKAQLAAGPTQGDRPQIDFSEAVSMIRDGQIQDGKTIATLLTYERFFAQGLSR